MILADRISLFPKILCGLNFQLKMPTDQSVLAYTLKQSRKVENDISSILLKFSRWVPQI